MIKAVGDVPKWDYFFYGPLIFSHFTKTSETAAYIQMARDTNSVKSIDAEPASGVTSAGEIFYLAKLFNKIGYNT